MPELGLAAIDTSVQQTNRWLGALMADMDTHDKQFAFQALRSVLTTLRDRLPSELAANLGAQLPLLVRGVYYDGYVPAETPTKYRRAADWNAAVASAGDNLEGEDVERASRAVLGLLRWELDDGIVAKVADALPDDVRAVVVQ